MIPHPAGGGRQQPDPADYTIRSAAYANAEMTAAVLQTDEAGAVLASAADTPALWAKLRAGPVAAYRAPPAPPAPPEDPELVALRQALIDKSVVTEAEIEAARPKGDGSRG